MNILSLPKKRMNILSPAIAESIRLYIQRYSMSEELTWSGNTTSYNGHTFEIKQATQGRTNCPPEYVGYWFVTDVRSQMYLSNGKRELTGWKPPNVMFKTREQAIAQLEQTLGLPPSVCICDLFSVLMVTGCRCGALKREKEKHATRV